MQVGWVLVRGSLRRVIAASKVAYERAFVNCRLGQAAAHCKGQGAIMGLGAPLAYVLAQLCCSLPTLGATREL